MNASAEGNGQCERSRARKRWADLTAGQQGAVLALASVEFALTSAAAVDLFHRPQARLRGIKALWWPVLAVQPFGPIVYLALARRRRRVR
jgi:hypothetical protein